MKSWLLILLVAWTVGGNDTAKINSLKKEAEAAYKKGDYKVSAEKFSYLVDSMHIEDESAVLNLGHSYFHLGQSENSQAQYQKLTLSKNDQFKSIAYQQLGALSNDPKTLEKALAFFKSSLKANPANDDARYNYELIKKKLQDQKDQNQDNQDQDKKDQDDKQDQDKEDKKENEQKGDDKDQKNEDGEKNDSEDQEKQDQNSEQDPKDQEKKDPKDQDPQKGKEGENQEQKNPEQQQEGEENEDKSDQPPRPSTADKLQEMNISEEKAKMILEALKNSEIQYIQQNQRRATQKQDNGKPDW